MRKAQKRSRPSASPSGRPSGGGGEAGGAGRPGRGGDGDGTAGGRVVSSHCEYRVRAVGAQPGTPRSQ